MFRALLFFVCASLRLILVAGPCSVSCFSTSLIGLVKMLAARVIDPQPQNRINGNQKKQEAEEAADDDEPRLSPLSHADGTRRNEPAEELDCICSPDDELALITSCEHTLNSGC